MTDEQFNGVFEAIRCLLMPDEYTKDRIEAAREYLKVVVGVKDEDSIFSNNE